jgi:hypothetical protein
MRRSWRRVAGFGAAAATAIVAILSVLGVWNPWGLVVLWRYFGNPLRDAAVVFALALVAAWLLAPVRSEVTHVNRLRLRIGLGLALLVSLIGLGLFDGRFSTAHTVLATTPDGSRSAVMYDPGTDDQRLHIWAGRGPGARHVGDLGHPCGAISVSFRGVDLVHVSTSYGEFDLRLDPATGRPMTALGATCAG